MSQIAVVSVSGGKDSTATLLIALERLPKDQVIPVFADTGNEHEQTYRYVRDYLPSVLGLEIHEVRADFTDWMAHRRSFVEQKYPESLQKGRVGKWLPAGDYIDDDDPEVVEVRPDMPEAPAYQSRRIDVPGWKWQPPIAPLTAAQAAMVIERILAALQPTKNPFLDLCLIKGRFPSRRAQFCTQHLKTEPLAEFQMALIEKHGAVESWQGVRADESSWRAKLPELEHCGGGLSIYRPILRWNVAQVFELLAARRVEPNILYRQGFTRVGCMPCIHAKKDEFLEISRRYPGHIERIAMWEEMVKLASKRGDASFFPDPDEDAHLKRRGVRAMVEWAKTSRGGVQYDLMRVTDEPQACASAYGLCE